MSHRNWLEQWFEHNAPQYENAFYAFMAIIKDRSKGSHVIESNGLYEALDATINLLRFIPMLKAFASDYIPPAILEIISKLNDELIPKLIDIKSRCIEQDGITCIAPNDLAKLIEMTVDFINSIASLISNKIEELVEPFNQFIADFDDSIKIDLVDGKYYILVEEESKEQKEKLEKLHKELNKTRAKQQAMQQMQNVQKVFVVCDKADVINYVQQRWADKIELTSHGEKSLLDSGFKDIKLIVAAFDLLAIEYHQTYANKLRIDDAIAATEAIGIEFKPSMSDTTMGNHPIYQRQYNNRPADFSRHLCMGTSRRPEHCMRIHFEWDEEQNKIVIHHAGNHLPCSN